VHSCQLGRHAGSAQLVPVGTDSSSSSVGFDRRSLQVLDIRGRLNTGAGCAKKLAARQGARRYFRESEYVLPPRLATRGLAGVKVAAGRGCNVYVILSALEISTLRLGDSMKAAWFGMLLAVCTENPKFDDSGDEVHPGRRVN
jgi:hypothetical protein